MIEMAWQLRSQKRKDAIKDWEESREEEDEDKLEEDESEGGEQGEILGIQAEIVTTMEERRDVITEIEPRTESTTTTTSPTVAAAASTNSTTTLLLNLIQTMNDERRKNESKRDERWKNVIKILAGSTTTASGKKVSEHDGTTWYLRFES